MRKAQFSRPEPGFSLYEGRTRGKRIRYTYSDNEEESDATGSRRSARYSGQSTPADAGPVVTASGRQVRPARTGIYGETLLSGQGDTASETSRTSGRATRSSRRISPLHEERKRKSRGYNSFDEESDEDDDHSSGNEWDGGDDDDDNNDDVDMADAEDEDEMESDQEDVDRSLIVKLKINKKPQEPTETFEEKPPPATYPLQHPQEQPAETAALPILEKVVDLAASQHPPAVEPNVQYGQAQSFHQAHSISAPNVGLGAQQEQLNGNV